MKKIILSVFVITASIASASAQLLPSFQFGVKGGVNLSRFSTSLSTGLSSDNRAGYLAGFWARIGGAGINFQPELYYTNKSATINSQIATVSTSGITSSSTISEKATYKSIDLPLLIGTKFGVLGNGIRVNTGPVISFAVDKNQDAKDAFSNATALHFKDQNYAWQFGVGADVRRLSVDLRYEAGITKVDNDYNQKTRLNLFNLTLGYRLFSL